jgi:hypothetical protein
MAVAGTEGVNRTPDGERPVRLRRVAASAKNVTRRGVHESGQTGARDSTKLDISRDHQKGFAEHRNFPATLPGFESFQITANAGGASAIQQQPPMPRSGTGHHDAKFGSLPSWKAARLRHHHYEKANNVAGKFSRLDVQ